MDRRNTVLKPFCGGVVLQGLSGAFVELSRDGAEFGLAMDGHVEAAREV
jgi:hypothetical protein